MTRWIRWSLPLLVACAGQSGSQGEARADDTPDGAEAAPAVVATVAGEPVTMDDLMEFAGSEIIQAEIALHEARQRSLDALITSRLLDAEAEKRGMDADTLLQTEVQGKITMPTDEDIATFYNENKARIQAPLDQAKPQIVQFLMQERSREAMFAYLGSLREGVEVKTHLEPYRVEVAMPEGAPRWGSASAPIQIVEFSDFQCPYCSRGAATVEEIKEKYGDKVSIVFRHFPLDMHPQAPAAAAASLCANEQGKFWEFHDALFENNKAWTNEDYKAIAKEVGAKKKPFAECLESGRHDATVAADMEAGAKAGMSGTPGYYINGIVLNGAQPLEVFTDVIDRELARL